MATPPYPPPPPGNDPRQQPGQPAWQPSQKDQAKAWRNYHRNAARQQFRAARDQRRAAAEAMRAQSRAWRRSQRAQSFVGPLLLIGFATTVLLVSSGHVSWTSLLTWFSRWWPLVLIAAGLIRLAEWALARHNSPDGNVPVRYSLGGGTVFLLAVLTALGFASQGALHATDSGIEFNTPFAWDGRTAWQQFLGSRHEQDAPALTHAIAADGTLQIDNTRGDVTVSGTSDDGLVHIAQHQEVFADNDGRATDLFADLAPRFSGSEQSLALRVTGPQSSISALTVLVPRTVHVILNANRGDVAANALHAPLTVNGNRCNVDVSAVVGEVQLHLSGRHASARVHSVQGAVQLDGSGEEINLNDVDGTARVRGDFFGSGRLQHVTGPVSYDAGRISFAARRIDGEVSFDEHDEFSASGLTGPVEISTRSRNLNLSHIAGDLHITNSSGHVDIAAVPPNGTVTVDNRDGDVSLSLPASAKFDLTAETTDGNVSSSFPGVGAQSGSSVRGSMRANVGTGGPSIRLNTTHGDITLSQNTDAPLPPTAPTPPLAPQPATAAADRRPTPATPRHLHRDAPHPPSTEQ